MPYLPVSAGDVGVHPSEGVRRLIRVLGVVALDLVLRDGVGLARYLVLALEGAHLGGALGEFCPPAGTTSMATLRKITNAKLVCRKRRSGTRTTYIFPESGSEDVGNIHRFDLSFAAGLVQVKPLRIKTG